MGAGIPISNMDPEAQNTVLPIVRIYNTIMQCKNLGISFSAQDIGVDMLEYVHIFYTSLEEARSKKKGK